MTCVCSPVGCVCNDPLEKQRAAQAEQDEELYDNTAEWMYQLSQHNGMNARITNIREPVRYEVTPEGRKALVPSTRFAAYAFMACVAALFLLVTFA